MGSSNFRQEKASYWRYTNAGGRIECDSTGIKNSYRGLGERVAVLV